MSHSVRHTLKRQRRAKQKAKEQRVHRNAQARKWSLPDRKG